MLSRTLTATVIAFLAGALLAIWSSYTFAPSPQLQPQAPPSQAPQPQAPDSPSPIRLASQRSLQQRVADERRSVIVEAVQRVAPSVTSVMVRGRRRVSPFGSLSPFRDDFFEYFFSPFRSYERTFTMQTGSAVMISNDGEALTNDHVIAGADEIFLLLPDGNTVPAELVGRSSILDLALLRTGHGGVQPAPLGGSEDLIVGEWLVAVGYPVGGPTVTSASRFQPTVTVGVVSATERSFTPPRGRGERNVRYYPDMIQTDAAINPGNSGGPLANAAGEVVGISTFILTESGGSEGLGFAIPIERALRAAEEFRRYGEVRQVELGRVFLQTVTAELAEAFGLDAPRGMLIGRSEGAAAGAGLQERDILLDVDRKPVNSLEEVRLALIPRFVGDTVTLGVWRDERRIELSLTLEEQR